MIGWLLCLVKPHIYRRARKGEDATKKFCKRCGSEAVVNKRKKEAS